MCFHSKQSKTAQEIEHRFNAKFLHIDEYMPTHHYNGFTFPKTPVITVENPTVIEMISWGLIPEWATPDWNRNYTLNARWETLTEKPAFKEYTNNRCIILVDGFYEWQHIGKQKIKYEIGFNNQVFAFAGIYAATDASKSYTIITTEAQGVMREIHNTKLRMPIALQTDEEMHNWLYQNSVNPRYDFTVKPLDSIQGSLFDCKYLKIE